MRRKKRPVDEHLLPERVRDSVREVVEHQCKVGIDVVSDGEMSKPSYATYVTWRLTGFAGKSDKPKLSDILEHPNVASHYFNDPGVLRLNQSRPACSGPVTSSGLADAEVDIANFRHALSGVNAADAFMTTASPGVIESMSNCIEHPELLSERLVRLARIVGRKNSIAGSDCGFGTFVGVALVEPEIAWAKLQSMAEGARIASEELW